MAFDFRQRAPGRSLSTAFQPLHCKQPLHTRDSGTRLTSHLKLRRIQAVQAISCILEPEKRQQNITTMHFVTIQQQCERISCRVPVLFQARENFVLEARSALQPHSSMSHSSESPRRPTQSPARWHTRRIAFSHLFEDIRQAASDQISFSAPFSKFPLGGTRGLKPG